YFACLYTFGEVYEKIGDSAIALGNIAYANLKYKQAIDKYTEIHSLQKPDDYDQNRAYVLGLIGKIYFKMGRLKEARIFLDSSLRKTDSLHLRFVSRDTHLSLFQLDSLEGNYKAAMEEFREYVKIRDTLANSENDKKIL